MRSTIVAQPELLHQAAQFAGANKGRRSRLSGLRDPISFDQEQLPLTQPEEGLRAFGIRAMTQHIFSRFMTKTDCAQIVAGMQWNSTSSAL